MSSIIHKKDDDVLPVTEPTTLKDDQPFDIK